MLFQGVIGDDPNHPFSYQAGLFYRDGTVRDLVGVRAVEAASQLQGVKTWGNYQVHAPDLPDHPPYYPVGTGIDSPLEFGSPEVVDLVHNLSLIHI